MTVIDDTRLRGRTRWSMAARCPRQAAYGLFGEQPEEPDDETKLRWIRGKMDETWWLEQILEPRVGRDNIVREKAVPWGANGLPVGELHTDAFVVTEKRPYEVKSHFAGEPNEFDYVQIAGQMHFDEDVTDDVGVLVTIDRDLHWEAIPVMLTDERIEQVEDIARQVVTAGRSGDLPARVCHTPNDGRSLMCPFVGKCFAGWQRPQPLELDERVATLAREAVSLDLARKAAKATADEAEAAYKASLGQLAGAHEFPAGAVCRGHGVTVKRSWYSAHDELALKKARLAGVFTEEDEERFGPFISSVGGHSRFAIKTDVEVKPAAEDFGDEAPWSDEDLEGTASF